METYITYWIEMFLWVIFDMMKATVPVYVPDYLQ